MQNNSYLEGSRWFRRFIKDCNKISPYIRVKRIKYGFYRIFWKNIYIYECFKEMPQKGYDIEIENPKLENRSYFEEFEDNGELIRKVKNFVEGYWEALDAVKTRTWMLRHNDEYYKTSLRASSTMVVK